MSGGIGPGRVNLFNTTLQSLKFDADGSYIRMWVHELANVPNDYIHDPWNMSKALQKQANCEIVDDHSGKKETYPMPIWCDKYTSSDAAKKMKRSKSAPSN